MKQRPKGYSSPEEFIQSSTAAQRTCRLFRHAWDLDSGTVVPMGRTFEWTVRCYRGCGTTKTIRITTTGTVKKTIYHWSQAYHVKGGLRKPHLNALRAQLLQEVITS